jgi:AraC-like DNA-binding protein
MTSWVPAGAWLAPGYAEWAAPAGLRDTVYCLWASVVPDGAGERSSVILPDGCCDLIWEQGVGAYVAGPDTRAVSLVARPGSVSVGARFRPGHGGPALALPLSELRDRRVGLAEILSGSVTATLAADRAPADAAALVLDLAGRLVAGQEADPAVALAARLLRDPAARTEDVAREAGLSERQFRRRFHAAAGYGPKTLQRVLRFQRFVRQVDANAGVPDLAAVAADAGYADQAHLTRECKSLSGLTPTALAKTRG